MYLGDIVFLGGKGLIHCGFTDNSPGANSLLDLLLWKKKPESLWALVNIRNSDAYFEWVWRNFLRLQFRAMDHEDEFWKAIRMSIPDRFFHRNWNDISLLSQFLIGCSRSLGCLHSLKAGSILLPSVSVRSSLHVPYGSLIPTSLKHSQVP